MVCYYVRTSSVSVHDRDFKIVVNHTFIRNLLIVGRPRRVLVQRPVCKLHNITAIDVHKIDVAALAASATDERYLIPIMR